MCIFWWIIATLSFFRTQGWLTDSLIAQQKCFEISDIFWTFWKIHNHNHKNWTKVSLAHPIIDSSPPKIPTITTSLNLPLPGYGILPLPHHISGVARSWMQYSASVLMLLHIFAPGGPKKAIALLQRSSGRLRFFPNQASKMESTIKGSDNSRKSINLFLWVILSTTMKSLVSIPKIQIQVNLQLNPQYINRSPTFVHYTLPFIIGQKFWRLKLIWYSTLLFLRIEYYINRSLTSNCSRALLLI